jgi:quinol monooxygenase YgiN
MIRKIARYVVKEDQVENVKPVIEEFISAIKQYESATLYHAYQADDGVTFFHVMAFPDEEAEDAHRTAAHTLRFVEELYPRCEEPPIFNDLTLVHTTDDA